MEDAHKQLSSTCKRINTEEGSISTVGKQSKLEAELSALRACHNEMGCFELETYKVDKWSTICMKASHYSVPDTLLGKLAESQGKTDEFLHPQVTAEQSADIEDGSLQILSKLSRMIDSYKN